MNKYYVIVIILILIFLTLLVMSLQNTQNEKEIVSPEIDQNEAVKLLLFKTKVINSHDNGNIVEVSNLVKILNPNKKSLEVCINYLDEDDFAVEQFCRTMRVAANKFQQKADTTIFRCSRTFNTNGWVRSTVSIGVD